MKLLGWMHRKFRQNSSEPQKEFAIRRTSMDDQHFYSKPYGTTPFRQPQSHLRKSFAGLASAHVEEEEQEDYEDESSSAMSELFHGFLAIGTLGSDPNLPDPSTPTFSISVENITEKEMDVTENELKLINYELERVLGAEAKEEGCNDSSRRNSHVSTGRNSHVSTGRNSHVSTGRSSHGSIITLSGKPTEGPDTNGNGTTVCPLQGYLFGSAIELSETTTVAKKENRTSLGDLFQKTKIAEESFGSKHDKEEKRMEKEGDKSAVHAMKKILKKKMLNASRSTVATGGGNNDPVSAETKLHKILHMFHKKVHPESSTATHKHNKPQKNENKKDMGYDGGHMLTDEDIVIFPQRTLSKDTRRYISQSNPSQSTLSCNESNGNRECWIKTDADYLVLEL